MKEIQVLKDIIDPIDPAIFEKEFLDKNFLRVERDQPDYFEKLFEIKDLNEFLGRRDIHYPKIKLIKDGRMVEKYKYVNTKQYGGLNLGELIDNEKLFKQFYSGATLAFHDLGKSFQRLYDLSQSLEGELVAKCAINGYLTPPHSSGFLPHFDTHDVFIIQLYGSKRWALHDHPIPLAHPSHTGRSDNRGKEEPESEFILKMGETLYIPRGRVHAVRTEDEMSFHLTIGIHNYKWTDFFKHIALNSYRDVDFRDSLRKDFFESFDQQAVDELMQKFSQKLVRENYSSFQELTIRDQIPNAENRLQDALRLTSLALHSCIKIRSGIRFQIREHEEELILHFYQEKISFGKEKKLAIEWILKNGRSPFLVTQLPDHYSSQDQVEICALLIRVGFLTFVN